MSMAVAVRTMAAPGMAQRAPALARAEERPASLPALTGLRFFAALWVVVGHGVIVWGLGGVPDATTAGPLAALARLVYSLLVCGSQAVGFFFTLSGFILAYTYATGAGRVRGGLRRFYVARLARIYPAYLLAVGFMLAALCLRGDLSWRVLPALAATLGLAQAWLPSLVLTLNAPAWSLSCEAFFYALFPLLAGRLARLEQRGLLGVCGVCWLVSCVLPWCFALSLLPHALQAAPWTATVLAYHPLLRVPAFVMGVALGRLFVLRGASAPRPWRLRPGQVAVATAAALAALLVILAHLPGAVRPYGITDGLWGLLIYALATGQGRLAGALSVPGLLVLGDASYGLYLLHWPLFTLLAGIVVVPVGAAPAALPFLGAFAGLAIALALLSVRLVEQPARRAIVARWGVGARQ